MPISNTLTWLFAGVLDHHCLFLDDLRNESSYFSVFITTTITRNSRFVLMSCMFLCLFVLNVFNISVTLGHGSKRNALRKALILIIYMLCFRFGLLQGFEQKWLLAKWQFLTIVSAPTPNVWCQPGTSGLSFHSIFLSPLSLSLFFFFCLVFSLFLSGNFSDNGPSSDSPPPPRKLKYFRLFLCLFSSSLSSCWAAGSRLVGGMCGLLPYGSGICHYAFI